MVFVVTMLTDGPPVDFWKHCIDELRKIKNVFMLG